MAFFNGWDAGSVLSRKSHSSRRHHHHHHSSSHKRHSRASASLRTKSRSRSRSRSRPPAERSIFGASIFGADHDSRHRSSRHNSSRTSFFGLPHVSGRSLFGTDFHRSSTSSYRRSPRPSFLTRVYKQLRRLLRDLVYYAKRHPVKVFTLVVLPLVTGGALTALLARFGLRLPRSMERMLGVGARAVSGDAAGLMGEAVRMASGSGGERRLSVDRGPRGGLQWERKSWRSDVDGGWGDGVMKSVREWF